MVAEIAFRAVFAGSYTAICASSGRATTTTAMVNSNRRRMVASFD